MRLFTLLLFVYGVSYAPVHLALETHLDDHQVSSHQAEHRFVEITAPGHEDGSGHAPHLASDHVMRLLSQSQSSFASFDLFIELESSPILFSQRIVPLFLTERQNPPGLPPPDPFQPRGPPLA